jgi:hypothetical protein
LEPQLKKKIILALALPAIFLFRLHFGMSKFAGQDEIQVFLIGLKYYCSGIYPYWGADAVGGQIPGGMLGLLTGGPLFWWPKVEGPYWLLNLFSFSGLLLLAYYFHKRMAMFPFWWLVLWLMLSPWTLHFSTHIENPSYVLTGSILFFIGLAELTLFYKNRLYSPIMAFFMLGFSLGWIMQFHLSWILLPPMICLAFWERRRERAVFGKGMGSFGIGFGVCGIALWPVIRDIGWEAFFDTSRKAVLFHPENLLYFPLTAVRFLSFSCFEIVRFIGYDNPSRFAYLQEHIYAVPLVILLTLAGVTQCVWLVICFFRRLSIPHWRETRWAVFFLLILLQVSFCFSVSLPASHTFYLLLPLSFWYALQCWSPFVNNSLFRPISVLLLLSGTLFFELRRRDFIATKQDLEYWKPRIQQAIKEMDYTIVGLRRPMPLEEKRMLSPWSKRYLGDTALLCQTSFEYGLKAFKPSNIVFTKPYHGHYTCKIDSLQPFGLNFQDSISQIKAGKILLQVQWMMRQEGTIECLLVTEIWQGSTRIHWQSAPVSNLLLGEGNWSPMGIEMPLSKPIANGQVLRTYLWLTKGNGRAWIDEVRLKVSTTSSLQ